MPEYLRSFAVVTVLMMLAYVLSKRFFAQALEAKFVDRLFTAGYGATAILFLANNMWLFLAGLAGVSFLVARRLRQPLALFVFLILLMPGFSAQVPGFGLINFLIDLNPQRILALVLLLPAAIHLAARPELPRPGKLLADKVVIVFTVYTTILSFIHYDTFTGALRHLSTTMLDFVLLYYVASRALLGKGAVRYVIVALIMAAIFLALVAGFEFAKHWLLYSSAQQVLGARSGMFGYLGRGDTLRALATTGQPIVLGFIMMVATLLTVYAQRLVPPGSARTLLWLIMVMGLFAAMSRGPWVGAAVGLGAIALASANPLGNLAKLIAAALAAAFFLLLIPGGGKILDYLPWVGTIDAGNITYRALLWEQSMLVLDKQLWIGSIGYTNAPEFDVIRQAGNFVDIVNTYVGLLLSHGLIGLGLYVALIFLATVPNLFHAIRGGNLATESGIYAVALLGALVATIVTIWTVSSIGQIAPLTTLVLGAGVARAAFRQQHSTRQPAPYPPSPRVVLKRASL